jgi:gamma-glutamylaminecyclotransferase
MSKRIFVYGTLKKGFHNHRCLEGAHFVKETCLTTPFRMFDTGGFPVILPATTLRPGYFPTGEVWELPEGGAGELVLARLDRLESEGHMYHRQEFYDLDDDIVSVYVGDPKVFQRFDNQDYLGKNILVDDKAETVSYVRAA